MQQAPQSSLPRAMSDKNVFHILFVQPFVVVFVAAFAATDSQHKAPAKKHSLFSVAMRVYVGRVELLEVFEGVDAALSRHFWTPFLDTIFEVEGETKAV